MPFRNILNFHCTTVVFCVCFLFANSSDRLDADEIKLLYHSVVKSETAEVRSFPGKVHYATDRLSKGTKVAVYREDPGGYLLIQPPRGSFNLVLASQVQSTTEDGIIEVTGDGVKAWVGTRLPGNFEPMWQTKLKRGELLHVIKKVEIPGAYSDQSETWYQIEPPSGEFRWIHKDDVGSQAPRTVSSTEIVQQNIDIEKSQLVEPPDESNSKNALTAREGWKAIQVAGPRSANATLNIQNSRPKFELPSEGSFKSKVELMDLELSNIVVSPKSTWDLKSLELAATQLRSQAVTGDELAAADRLAEKIVGFQKVKSVYSTEGSFVAEAGARLGNPSFVANANGSRPVMNRGFGNRVGGNQVRYDGRGVLRKLVVNGGVGKPIYALENEQGKIVKTITPSSGVNLERFVGKPVGLYGKSGFNSRLNQPHLTAQRVIDLNRVR